MKFKKISYKKILFWLFPVFALFFLLLPGVSWAMEPGTLLYRTTDDGKMFGYSGDPLIESNLGVMTGVNPGHVGIYIGQEDGVDYVVEALANGIVKTRLEHFVNESLGEEFLGAKIPKDLSPLRQAKAVLLAKNLADANLDYDIDFKKQKGPGSGEWTCVGLTEKIYESADISNPTNLFELEYDSQNYAVDITPDGYDDYSFYNKEGDCFSRDKEFSYIAPRSDLILPLAENYGFNAGLIYKGDRYIFLPYTQFLQPSLEDVTVDKKISSEFSSKDLRGGVKVSALLLRWSLINNPVSAVKIAKDNIKDGVASVISGLKTAIVYASEKIFHEQDNNDNLVLINNDQAKKDIVEIALNQEKTGSTLSKIGGVTVATTNSSKIETKKESSTNNLRATTTESMATTTSLEKVKASLSSLITATTQASTTTKTSTTTQGSMVTQTSTTTQALSSSVQNLITSSQTSTTTQASNLEPASYINSNSSQTLNEETTNESMESQNLSVMKNEVVTETIKIGKIYATGDNDFVELYNPNNFAIDLSKLNYRLEKAKTAIDPGIMIRIGNTADGSYPGGTIIPAKGYYLIVKESASDYYLSRADAIATRSDFNLTGLNQTVYLGLGAISSYDDEDIVDVVGFGLGATYYLGSEPAPKITDYHFLNRHSYQNNNSLDYSLLLSAEPAAVSAWELENNNENATAPIEDEELPLEEDPLAPIEDEELPLEEDPLVPIEDEEPFLEEDPLVPIEDEELPLEEIIENPDEIEMDLAIRSVMINKIGVFSNDDYIELINFSNHDIDLAFYNFRLEKTKTATDPTIMIRIGDPLDGYYPGGTIIEAGSSYLIVREGASTRFLELADAIATRSEFNLGGEDYSIFLGLGPISSADDEDVLDLLGYGLNAIYYFGEKPAPAIPDHYFLNRNQFNSQNFLDFTLMYDYSYIEDNPEIINGDLLATQNSSGIKYLWNLDDCYAELSGQAIVGKWACGRKFGHYSGNFSGNLVDGLDMDSFTIGFYHHNDYHWPKIDISLTNDYGNSFAVSMAPGSVNIGGVVDGATIYTDTDFGDDWNYFTLVVNRPESYWAVYSNGNEVVRRSFLADLPEMKYFSLSGGSGSMSFDELVIWERALSQEEIMEIIFNDLPLAPRSLLRTSPRAELIYHWDFSEYGEGFTYDKISNQVLNINQENWTSRSPDNHAALVSSIETIKTELVKPLAFQDLSLAFWWRNAAHPNEGKLGLSLFERDQSLNKFNKFGLLASYNRQSYIFNNTENLLANASISLIPNDGAWHHLALIYDSSQYKLKFFIDGEERLTKDQIPFQVGAELITNLEVSSDAHSSAIDDLMIFKGVLKDEELKSIYQETKEGSIIW